jgi:hypothetical protein
MGEAADVGKPGYAVRQDPAFETLWNSGHRATAPLPPLGQRRWNLACEGRRQPRRLPVWIFGALLARYGELFVNNAAGMLL